MSVTIKDVAEEAGVAPSTVSRVLSDSPRISELTKKHVLEVVKKLNYYPNTAAQNLVTRSTKTIGIVIPGDASDLFKNPFWINVIRGISIYAQENEYYISFATSKNDKEEMKILKDYVMRRVVDGIILLTARTEDQSIKFLKENKFPFSVVGKPPNTEDTLWVDNDNYKAMYDVVNELIALGHEEIAFIGGPRTMNVSQDRFNGYKDAIKDSQLIYKSQLNKHTKNFTEQAGYEITSQLFSQANPTAIVTTDDVLSVGANKFLKETGKQSIAIVGFNNGPLAEYQQPPLASVDINSEQLGYHGARLLVQFLETGDMGDNSYMVPVELIRRKSMIDKNKIIN